MTTIRTDQAHPCNSEKDRDLEGRILNYLYLRLPHVTEVEVEAQNGTVIVRGIVSSRSIQWQCRECCRHVAGVLNVIDRIVVMPSHDLHVVLDESACCVSVE